jgi:hypothetical protein
LANEQTALKAMEIIARLIQIDAELTRNEQPGLYDHIERLFVFVYRNSVEDPRTQKRTGAAWYDKRIHPLQIARLNRMIAADPYVVGQSVVAMLEQVVRCYEEDGVMDRHMDERTLQAKRLWAAHWGAFHGIESFEGYLSSIPSVPEASLDIMERFPNLMLVDGRVSLNDACIMADVFLSGENIDWALRDSWWKAPADCAYWLRCRADNLYRQSPTPKQCVDSLTVLQERPERQLSLLEGLFTCVHDFKKRRSLPMALSGAGLNKRCMKPDHWPLIAREAIHSIDATEHHELQVPICLVPKP